MGSLEEVEQALRRLESLEEITDDDLKQFKQTLPTDPETARLIQRALPFPWSEVFEYVGPSERQAAYWRPKYDRSQPRSEAEAAYRERFRKAASASRGARGTIDRDGKVVPLSAAIVGDSTEGRRFSAARARATGQKALRRLRDVLGV